MRRLLTILILTLCMASARAQTPQNALGHAVLYGDANGQATNSWTNLFNVQALGTVTASNVTAQNITLGGVTLSVWPSGGGGGGGSDNFSSLFDTNGSSQIDLSSAGYAAITNALSARVVAAGTSTTNFAEGLTNGFVNQTITNALNALMLTLSQNGSNYAATLSTNTTNYALTTAQGVGTSLTNDLANYVLTSALGTAAYSNAPIFASETALLAAGTSLSNDLGNYVLTSALGTAAYSNSPVFASETALLAAGTSLSNDLGNYALISSLGTIAYSNANQFQQTNTTLTGYASIPTNNMVMTNGANDVDFYTGAAYPLTLTQSGPTNTFGLNSLLTLMTNGNANALTNFSLASASTNGVQANWFYGFTNTGNALALTSNLPAAQLTGLVPTANEGSGSATSSTYLRGDRTWATPGGGGTVTSIGMAVDALGLLSGWSPSTITGSGTFTPTFSSFVLTNNFAAAVSFNTNVFTGGTNESTNGYTALGGKYTGLGTGLTNAAGVAYNTGTVTSVAAASDTLGFVSWSGSPITGSGTLTPSFAGFILTNNFAGTASFQTNVTIGGTNFSTNGFVAVGGIISGLGSGLTNAAGNGYVDKTITNGINTSLINAGTSITNDLANYALTSGLGTAAFSNANQFQQTNSNLTTLAAGLVAGTNIYVSGATISVATNPAIGVSGFQGVVAEANLPTAYPALTLTNAAGTNLITSTNQSLAVNLPFQGQVYVLRTNLSDTNVLDLSIASKVTTSQSGTTFLLASNSWITMGNGPGTNIMVGVLLDCYNSSQNGINAAGAALVVRAFFTNSSTGSGLAGGSSGQFSSPNWFGTEENASGFSLVINANNTGWGAYLTPTSASKTIWYAVGTERHIFQP